MAAVRVFEVISDEVIVDNRYIINKVSREGYNYKIKSNLFEIVSSYKTFTVTLLQSVI
jgi:hypothetical protein